MFWGKEKKIPEVENARRLLAEAGVMEARAEGVWYYGICCKFDKTADVSDLEK